MSVHLFPDHIRQKFRIDERHHATAILNADFSLEFNDLLAWLERFSLKRSAILTPGGGKSPIVSEIDDFFQETCGGWTKKRFDTQVVVDGEARDMPTHEIDNFRNQVGIEVEWNNKTEFYDRDLNNFRLLWQLNVVSVGVLIVRLTELQALFNELGKGKSYGASTTHWDKLIPKVDGGGAGGCPLLLIGMGMNCYDPNA